MTISPLLISLPIADRPRAHRFYRDALGLEPVGEPAEDGVPEPLVFELNEHTSLMLVPTGGFGWVIGDRQVAGSGTSECVLGLPAATDAEVDSIVDQRAWRGRGRHRPNPVRSHGATPPRSLIRTVTSGWSRRRPCRNSRPRELDGTNGEQRTMADREPFLEPQDMIHGAPLPGWSGRFFHSENMTFAHWDIAAGATDLHEHSHPQEEVWNVVEGEVVLVIDGVAPHARLGCRRGGPAPRSARRGVGGTCRAIVTDFPLRTELPGVARS